MSVTIVAGAVSVKLNCKKMTENRLQQICYTWFHNQYPQYRGLLCCNLNNAFASVPPEIYGLLKSHPSLLKAVKQIYTKLSRIRGAIAKSMGLQAGRSDMVLYFNKTAYMIELKKTKGRQSNVQIVWQNLIQQHGYEYVVIKTLEDFQEYIKSKIGDE